MCCTLRRTTALSFDLTDCPQIERRHTHFAVRTVSCLSLAKSVFLRSGVIQFVCYIAKCRAWVMHVFISTHICTHSLHKTLTKYNLSYFANVFRLTVFERKQFLFISLKPMLSMFIFARPFVYLIDVFAFLHIEKQHRKK